MAGHMGDVRVTTQNLDVVKVDVEAGLILVRGNIAGAMGSWVLIKDAEKTPAKDLPMPGKFKTAEAA